MMFAETFAGNLAWEVFGGTLRYAADLVPEISDDVVNVDRAMRWGFNWAQGPFELLDTVGPARFIDRLRSEGEQLPLMLRVMEEAGADSFYRRRDDREEFLGADGSWHPLPD